MATKVDDKLVEVIEFIADKIIKQTCNVSADEALKFTQAALNAAHAIQVLNYAK